MAQDSKLLSALCENLRKLIRLPEDSTPKGSQVINTIIAAVITRSTLILHGPPGCAKSTVIKLIAKGFGITGSWRVNGTAGTKEEDLVGGLDLAELTKGNRKVLFSPFIESPMALLDEVDKINPYSMAALLPLLAEGEARVGTECREVPKRFFAMTMNPPAPNQANFELPEALKDRADAEVFFPPTSFIELVDIYDSVLSNEGELVAAMPTLGAPKQLHALQQRVAQVAVSREAKLWASLLVNASTICKKDAKQEMKTWPACCADCELAEATLPCSKISPMSARAGISALNLAKGLSFMRGAYQVEPKDVDEVFPFAMSHRTSFVNEAMDSKRAFIINFFARLKGAVTPAYKIATDPSAIQAEDLEAFKKSADPLVRLAIKYRQEDLGQIGEKIKSKLRGMSAKQLKDAKRKGGLTMADRNLIDQMIIARKTIHLDTKDEAVLEDGEFRALFTSPEGEALFSPDNWEDVVNEGRISQTSLLGYLGVDMVYENAVLILMFEDADSADAFRIRLQQAAPWLAQLCPYQEASGLAPKLDEAGFTQQKGGQTHVDSPQAA